MKLKLYCILLILIIISSSALSCSNEAKSIDDLVVFLNKEGLEAERWQIRTLYSLIGATSGARVVVSFKDENGKYHTLIFETYKFPTIEQAKSWSGTADARNSIHFGYFTMYPDGGWKDNFDNNEIYQRVKEAVKSF